MGKETDYLIFREKEKSVIEKISLFIERLKNKEIIVTTDIDGVDAGTFEKARQKFNQDQGTNYEASANTKDFIMVEWAKQLSIKEPRKYVTGLFHSEEVIAGALPEPGSLILHRFFNDQGIIVPRVSTRPNYVREFTYIWYRQWMPWVKEENIHMNHRDEIDPGFKVQTVKNLGANYHFEDSCEHAENISKESGAIVIMIPQYWNKYYFPTDEKIIKVPDNTGLPKIMAAFFTMVDIEALC